jgi:hypothetical protein
MRLRTKLCFGLSMVLLGLFLLGISPVGQHYLVGAPSPDHLVLDDQVMGAGLAPFVYCLVPSVALFLASMLLCFFDRRSRQKGQKSL